MTRRRAALACSLAVLASPACGSRSTSAPAQTRTITLGWHEETGAPGARFVVEVQRLIVRPNGWSVTAAVTNKTHVTFMVGRPHHPGETEFGVVVLPNADLGALDAAGPGVYATSLQPPVPHSLAPGDGWRGTFTGRGRLENGRYVRIELGRFTTVGPAQEGVPWRFSYITDHVTRLG